MKNLTKLLTSILLLMVAILLFQLLFIPIIIVSLILIIGKKDKSIALKSLSNWIKGIALSIDQLGNVFGQKLFNSALIKKSSIYKSSIYKFSNADETISSVLGRNQLTRTLTKTGCIIVWTLDKIDKNHCIKYIGN